MTVLMFCPCDFEIRRPTLFMMPLAVIHCVTFKAVAMRRASMGSSHTNRQSLSFSTGIDISLQHDDLCDHRQWLKARFEED